MKQTHAQAQQKSREEPGRTDAWGRESWSDRLGMETKLSTQRRKSF